MGVSQSNHSQPPYRRASVHHSERASRTKAARQHWAERDRQVDASAGQSGGHADRRTKGPQTGGQIYASGGRQLDTDTDRLDRETGLDLEPKP